MNLLNLNFDDFRNGVIVIGTAFNSNDQTFIILKKENDTFQIALTADVNSFLLRDLIQNTANQDISSIPYFGSLITPELGLAVSSGPITSDLIHLCFDNTILLSCYGDTIPLGFSGFVKFNFSSAIFSVKYYNETTSFRVVKGTLYVRDLLALIPGVSIPDTLLPFGFPNILDISLRDFGFDLDNAFYINVDLGKGLNFFDGILPPINTPSITLRIDNFIGGITPDLKIVGSFRLGNFNIPINMDYLQNLGLFKIQTDFRIPSLSIVYIVNQLTDLSLPLPDSFTITEQSFKIAGELDNLANGIIVMGATFNSNDQAFVILQREDGTTKTAVAADINSLAFSELVQDVADQDISSIPYFGSLMIPELGLTVSSGPITSDLIGQEVEKLISILAQLEFTHTVKDYDNRGVPFRTHLYVPEVHPVTGKTFYEREDPGHVLKVRTCIAVCIYLYKYLALYINQRIAKCTRNGGPEGIELEHYEHLLDYDKNL